MILEVGTTHSTVTKDDVIPVMFVKFDCSKIPEHFFTSTESGQKLDQVIKDLDSSIKDQTSINKAFESFAEVVLCEMKEHLPSRKVVHYSVRKKCKYKKQWWNLELADLWKNLCEAERLWCKSNGPRKQQLKSIYVARRKTFDKECKRAKRVHVKKTLQDMEELCKSDPGEFWRKIGQVGIGNERRKTIPMEVKLEDGSVSKDMDKVMDTWYKAYSDILNCNGNISQTGVTYSTTDEDDSMSDPISHDEIKSAIGKAKQGKAPGLDNIPIEVLKNEKCARYMYNLFNICFEEGCIPSEWTKAVINPIPKSSTE
ncbi:uncharacterized protein LOC124127630 [Haliotis rufescens]|uniref:uncharacterized protein LOC124127630 n=1 Tax=Haliotis rufescens TaxID=6454 RepID=UPI001EB0760C|nr:uncharacterized protein LOC124127630 [Haliotis rufescens]